jgi:hypothetical protein
MSLHPQDFSVVPDETVRVARAAFPKGNSYMILRYLELEHKVHLPLVLRAR